MGSAWQFFSGASDGQDQSKLDELYAQVFEPEDDEAKVADSTVLLLLHPTPLHHGFWLPVVEQLKSNRCIVPDLRGHGRSPLGRAAWQDDELPVLTVGQLARDAIALLDSLEIKRAVCVGCSIGGYTLYELWRTAPERVAGLVFCASKPQADTDAQRTKRGTWIGKMEPARLARESKPTVEFVDSMLAALLSKETLREQPHLVGQVKSMMEQVGPEAIQAIQRGLGRRPDAQAAAATITVPSCVIAGEEDTSSTPEDLAALHGLLGKSGALGSYHLLADAGHYGPFEQPTVVAGILNAFLPVAESAGTLTGVSP